MLVMYTGDLPTVIDIPKQYILKYGDTCTIIEESYKKYLESTNV